MKFLVAAATHLALANAIITGFAAPQKIRPGDTVPITIITANYIQRVENVAFAMGYRLGPPVPQSLGFPLGDYFLGPAKSNVLGNLTQLVEIPENAPLGNTTLSASFMNLYGVLNMPVLENYNVTVEFGSETSDELVRSF